MCYLFYRCTWIKFFKSSVCVFSSLNVTFFFNLLKNTLLLYKKQSNWLNGSKSALSIHNSKCDKDLQDKMLAYLYMLCNFTWKTEGNQSMTKYGKTICSSHPWLIKTVPERHILGKSKNKWKKHKTGQIHHPSGIAWAVKQFVVIVAFSPYSGFLLELHVIFPFI